MGRGRGAVGPLVAAGAAALAVLALAVPALVPSGDDVPAAGWPPSTSPQAPLAGTVPPGVATGAGWVRTWQAAAQPAPEDSFAAEGLDWRTVRMRVRTSVGGDVLRVTVSNEYGRRPLSLAGLTVGLPVEQAGASPAVQPGSLRAVTFAGERSVRLGPGEVRRSDAVAVDVPSSSDLLVSAAVAGPPRALTGHTAAVATTWVSTRGDHTGAEGREPFTGTAGSWVVVTALDVVDRAAAAVPAGVVAFGDSITDGVGATRDADARWPDVLAGTRPGLAVVNAGIGGNRILRAGERGGPAARDRFARDALDVPGVRVVVVMLGINDIQQRPRVEDPGEIVAGLADLARRAHARDLRVVLMTLTPYEGRRAWTREGERTRAAVNEWIRTRAVRGGHADAVVDTDAALRDPAAPQRLNPAYDSGDRLHPNDAGYAVIAGAVDRVLDDVLPTASPMLEARTP